MRHINYSIRITSTSCSHPREPAYQPLWSIKINRSEATTSTNEIFFTLVECAQLSVWLNWDLWLPQDSCWSFKKNSVYNIDFFLPSVSVFSSTFFPPSARATFHDDALGVMVLKSSTVSLLPLSAFSSKAQEKNIMEMSTAKKKEKHYDARQEEERKKSRD